MEYYGLIPVILSHWDADHYYGALMEPQIYSSTWVVPRQNLGPLAKQVATKIGIHGRILVWPYSLADRNWSGGLTVAKCLGRSKNDSGLAVGLSIRSAEIFLAGDADYACVPKKLYQNLDILVASHHGGKTRSRAPSPGVNKKSYAILSNGIGNSFGHPHQSTVQQLTTDWGRVLRTNQGTIGFAPVGHASCGRSTCGLLVRQRLGWECQLHRFGVQLETVGVDRPTGSTSQELT